jgi:hypothetical protein
VDFIFKNWMRKSLHNLGANICREENVMLKEAILKEKDVFGLKVCIKTVLKS